jgi:hypothetical protein
MMRSRWIWVLPVGLAVAACSSPPPKGDAVGGAAPATVTASKISEPVGRPVTITPVKWTELESAIAAHKGKVVVLDVWGEF